MFVITLIICFFGFVSTVCFLIFDIRLTLRISNEDDLDYEALMLFGQSILNDDGVGGGTEERRGLLGSAVSFMTATRSAVFLGREDAIAVCVTVDYLHKSVGLTVNVKVKEDQFYLMVDRRN